MIILQNLFFSHSDFFLVAYFKWCTCSKFFSLFLFPFCFCLFIIWTFHRLQKFRSWCSRLVFLLVPSSKPDSLTFSFLISSISLGKCIFWRGFTFIWTGAIPGIHFKSSKKFLECVCFLKILYLYKILYLITFYYLFSLVKFTWIKKKIFFNVFPFLLLLWWWSSSSLYFFHLFLWGHFKCANTWTKPAFLALPSRFCLMPNVSTHTKESFGGQLEQTDTHWLPL